MHRHGVSTFVQVESVVAGRGARVFVLHVETSETSIHVRVHARLQRAILQFFRETVKFYTFFSIVPRRVCIVAHLFIRGRV